MDDKTIAGTTGAAVRAEAARVGMSLRVLAREMGVSHAYITRRVSGRIAFNVTDLDTIARILGISVSVLVPQPREANGSAA